MKLRTNDQVIVIAGKDKGKLERSPDNTVKNTVVVERSTSEHGVLKKQRLLQEKS